MVREMERKGLPTVFFSSIPAIPLAFGATRILPGRAIRHLLGDPALPPDRERKLRREMIETALQTLSVPCEKPTLFPLAT
jgi:glycine reductase complex component B subunit gamma